MKRAVAALLLLALCGVATAQDDWWCNLKQWSGLAVDGSQAITGPNTEYGYSYGAAAPIVMISDPERTPVGMAYSMQVRADEETGYILASFAFEGAGMFSVQGPYNISEAVAIPVTGGTGKFANVIHSGFTKFVMGPAHEDGLLEISFFSSKPLIKC